MSPRTLLDEALPRGLAAHLNDAGYDIDAYPTGWRGFTDGRMLEAFGGGTLVTRDRDIRFQQNFGRRGIRLVVLPGQRLAQLIPLIGQLVPVLRAASVRDIVVVERDGRTVYHSA